MTGISGSLIWSKTLMELIFNPYGEFQLGPEGPVSQIHSLHLHDGTPGIFSDLLRSVQTLKTSGVRKATGSYCIYSSLVKLQTWFLSLRLKTCLWAELQSWCLSFQWNTCFGQNCNLGAWASSERPALTAIQEVPGLISGYTLEIFLEVWCL